MTNDITISNVSFRTTIGRHSTLPVVYQYHEPSAWPGARNISISLVVCLDLPVRFVQQFCSYFALCLLLLRWGFRGHNVLVSLHSAASLQIAFLFLRNSPYKRKVQEHNIITWWNSEGVAFAISSSVMLPAHIVFASSQQYRLGVLR